VAGTVNTLVRPKDSLALKTASTPVAEAPVEGLLLFYPATSKAVLNDPGTRISLSVGDAFGNRYETSKRVGDWNAPPA